jgi:hypothetical protein
VERGQLKLDREASPGCCVSSVRCTAAGKGRFSLRPHSVFLTCTRNGDVRTIRVQNDAAGGAHLVHLQSPERQGLSELSQLAQSAEDSGQQTQEFSSRQSQRREPISGLRDSALAAQVPLESCVVAEQAHRRTRAS